MELTTLLIHFSIYACFDSLKIIITLEILVNWFLALKFEIQLHVLLFKNVNSLI